MFSYNSEGIMMTSTKRTQLFIIQFLYSKTVNEYIKLMYLSPGSLSISGPLTQLLTGFILQINNGLTLCARRKLINNGLTLCARRKLINNGLTLCARRKLITLTTMQIMLRCKKRKSQLSIFL